MELDERLFELDDWPFELLAKHERRPLGPLEELDELDEPPPLELLDELDELNELLPLELLDELDELDELLPLELLDELDELDELLPLELLDELDELDELRGGSPRWRQITLEQPLRPEQLDSFIDCCSVRCMWVNMWFSRLLVMAARIMVSKRQPSVIR